MKEKPSKVRHPLPLLLALLFATMTTGAFGYQPEICNNGCPFEYGYVYGGLYKLPTPVMGQISSYESCCLLCSTYLCEFWTFTRDAMGSRCEFFTQHMDGAPTAVPWRSRWTDFSAIKISGFNLQFVQQCTLVPTIGYVATISSGLTTATVNDVTVSCANGYSGVPKVSCSPTTQQFVFSGCVGASMCQVVTGVALGGDVKGTPDSAPTPQACCDAAKTPTVVGFSWNQTTQECSLLTGLSSVVSSPDTTSGMIAPLASCELEFGVAVNPAVGSTEISAKPLPAYADCCDACTRDIACFFFTYEQDTTICHLYSKASGKVASSNRISGYRGSYCYVEFGWDYYGFDIRQSSEPSYEQCCQRCSEESDCSYWTWAAYTTSCQRKSSEAGRRRMYLSLRSVYISGWKGAVPAPATGAVGFSLPQASDAPCTMEYGYVYGGLYPLQTITGLTDGYETCCQKCNTYFVSGKTCSAWTFTVDGTGQRTCDLFIQKPMSGQLVTRTRWTDFSVVKISGLQSGQVQLCALTPTIGYVATITGGATTGSVDDVSVSCDVGYSGIPKVACSPTTQQFTFSGCIGGTCKFVAGVAFGGGVKGTPNPAATSQACCDAAKTQSGVVGFSWNRLTQVCTFLTDVSSLTSAPAIVSGLITPLASCELEFGVAVDTSSGATEISANKLASYGTCCDACTRDPACLFFTYEQDTTICHLYSKASGKVASSNRVTGYRGSYCSLEFGYDYIGNNIRQSSEASYEQCCQRCGEETDCLYWTWTAGAADSPGTCQRKSSNGGRQISFSTPIKISGRKIAAVPAATILNFKPESSAFGCTMEYGYACC